MFLVASGIPRYTVGVIVVVVALLFIFYSLPQSKWTG